MERTKRMIHVIEQNILTVTKGAIVHQVNCRGAMGSGIAAQIRTQFPHVYKEYAELCESVEKAKRYSLLGKIQIVQAEPGKNDLVFVNLFGQLSTSREQRETDYHALHQGLIRVVQHVPHLIYLPFNIGCGFGGGDWNIVHQMIDDVFTDANRDVTLCRYTP